ncbi:MAG: zinc-ribbon domain-containing protein [Roseibium sp.]|nr:zinc-ribbon domain-containing protein [Roseibium sp.]
MKIKCPDCSTSYDIKAEALGPKGRSVKCARCGNRWFVAFKPEDEELAPLMGGKAVNGDPDEAAWTEDAGAEFAETASGVDAPPGVSELDGAGASSAPSRASEAAKPIAPSERSGADFAEAEDGNDPEPAVDIETMANRPKIKVNPNKFRRDRVGAVLNWLSRRNYRRIGGLVLFATAIGLCAFLVAIRTTIVKQAPDLASLFETIGMDVNLRGLEFRDLRTFTEVADGEQVLVVEGSIRNIRAENNSVPAVQLTIRGTDLQDMYAWTVEPRTKTLGGLDETRFRTILADPPDGANDLQIRFVDRGERQLILE